MKPSTCPTCGALWAPSVAEKIAAKSENPPCFVCVWAQTDEGRRSIAEEAAREREATAGSRFAGLAPVPTAPTTSESPPGLFSSPTGVSEAPKEDVA